MTRIYRALMRSGMYRSHRVGVFGVAAASLLASGHAFAAWDFIPNALEWQSWPEYCRVQYATAGQGTPVPYDGFEAGKTLAVSWRATLGERVFDGLHHYCASIHFLSRSRAEPDSRSSEFLLHRAWDDAQFSYTRADPKSPVFPAMSVTVAQILVAMKKDEDAIDALKRSIEVQPERLEPYVMLAVTYRRQKKLDLAVKTMEQADAASGGESSEIHYNLGLIHLERGDLDAAVDYAKRAYKEGYPLDGLKRKLRAKGPPHRRRLKAHETAALRSRAVTAMARNRCSVHSRVRIADHSPASSNAGCMDRCRNRSSSLSTRISADRMCFGRNVSRTAGPATTAGAACRGDPP